MTTRTERRRAFNQAQVQAFLAAIKNRPDQQQLRERAATLARHGNDDRQIAVELQVAVEDVRRWIAEAAVR
jgi:hypothetical protein